MGWILSRKRTLHFRIREDEQGLSTEQDRDRTKRANIKEPGSSIGSVGIVCQGKGRATHQ
jgi:hypothetical protein